MFGSGGEYIVLIIFGSIFGMVAMSLLVSLAKKWIDRNNNSYDEQAFDRLAKAFIKHKKDTERRLQNIESIISGDSAAPVGSEYRKLREQQTHTTIEIEPDNAEFQNENDRTGNIRNMLHKKETE